MENFEKTGLEEAMVADLLSEDVEEVTEGKEETPESIEKAREEADQLEKDLETSLNLDKIDELKKD